MPLYNPAAPIALTAPSGTWQIPINMISVTAAVLVSGSFFAQPYDVGPMPKTFNAFGMNITTAQVAGTSTCSVGIYRDNGTGGLPNLVGGPIYSGTITTTAVAQATASVTMALAPGRYWAAMVWVASVAPSTVPQASLVNAGNSGWATNLGTIFRGVTATGQTALPTTQIALSGVISNVPLVGLRAA